MGLAKKGEVYSSFPRTWNIAPVLNKATLLDQYAQEEALHDMTKRLPAGLLDIILERSSRTYEIHSSISWLVTVIIYYFVQSTIHI